MAGNVRQVDMTLGVGSHGKLCCPHLLIGFFVTGSPTVITNTQPSVRAYTDFGIHNCPHCPVNMPIGGSPNVFINNLPAHRLGDPVIEFCGVGISVIGSPTVISN